MLSAGKDLDDAELRKIMSDPKEGGIGTEATRAAIVKMIVTRGYADRKGKQIFATNKGIDLIEKLPVSDLKSAEITAKWEKRLNQIASGEENVSDFISDINEATKKWCDEINSSATMKFASSAKSNILSEKCPLCGGDVVIHKWGWGCSNYKTGCKFSVSGNICGKSLSDKQVEKLIKNKEIGPVSGFKSKKTGKPFSAKLKMDSSGDIKFDFTK
jgi:DNA topoisomerase-3